MNYIERPLIECKETQADAFQLVYSKGSSPIYSTSAIDWTEFVDLSVKSVIFFKQSNKGKLHKIYY